MTAATTTHSIAAVRLEARPATSVPLLETRVLVRHFGGVRAVDGVDCRVEAGQIFSVIGPNGAGKTTFFNCLNGVTRPTSGAVFFEGREITAWAPHRTAALGVARTWQTIRLFAHMTVLENVLVGCHTRGRCGFVATMLRFPAERREERLLRAEALEQIERLGLADQAHDSVARLPFLRQRRVELARALAARPRLLLLDEPAAGLNTRETEELGRLIGQIRDTGVTVLLVEHDMSLVMEISDRVLVLDRGRPLAEGTPREVQENEKVIAVYLGTEEEKDEE